MENARAFANFVAAAALVLSAGTAIAAPGGAISTMPLGKYTCELPGDASGSAGVHVPEADFAVINASSYGTLTGRGIYLLTGDTLTMTGGPLRDMRFHRVANGYLRKLEADGSEGKLRCVRGGIDDQR